jgi:hypothetical protein
MHQACVGVRDELASVVADGRVLHVVVQRRIQARPVCLAAPNQEQVYPQAVVGQALTRHVAHAHG